jgi:hypothetical protein
LYGAEDLSSDEKDWEFWLKKIRARDAVDGAGLGANTWAEEDGDVDEKTKEEDDQKKDFEEWEWEYITHGVLRRYKAAHLRKHGSIRKRVIPDVVSPKSRHLSPSSARTPYNRYWERAFSPWDQILGGGDGGDDERFPPIDNLRDILEKEWEGEDANVEKCSLGCPHDIEPSNTGVEEDELRN